jgi:hypothetical protein
MAQQLSVTSLPIRSVLYQGLFTLFLGILVLRSGQYIARTIQEFLNPSPLFHPEITECSTEFLGTQGQLRGIYNYRSLGKPCVQK